MATEIHRNPSSYPGRRRSALQRQKTNPDNARGTRHLLHALARYNRQLDVVQSLRQGVPYNVLLLRPHAPNRFQFRYGAGGTGNVESRRTVGRVSGEYPAVDARQEKEEEREETAETGTATTKESHLAALLFPARYLCRTGRPRQILLIKRIRSKVGVQQ